MQNDRSPGTTDTFQQKLVRMVRELPDESLLALVAKRLGGTPYGGAYDVSPPSAVDGGGGDGDGGNGNLPPPSEVPDAARSGPGSVAESGLPDEALLALVAKRLGGTSIEASSVGGDGGDGGNGGGGGGGGPQASEVPDAARSGPGSVAESELPDEALLALVTERLALTCSSVV